MAQQFYSVLDAVWALDTDPTTKLVALRLARHWPQIFPGVQDVATWTGLDERTVRRALKKLQDEGVITVHRRPNTSSVYEFIGVSIPALGLKPPVKVPGDMPPPPGVLPGGTGHTAPPGPGVLPDKQPRVNDQPKNQGEGEPARELLPHEKAELRKLSEPTGARPLPLYEFRDEWKPKDSHRARGHELGLTDAEMLQRAAECRLKLYERPFRSEDKQFMLELHWLSKDKRGKANPHGRDENPGRFRKATDPRPPGPFAAIGAVARRTS